ncbi:MAG: 2-C-methyl-D-erythritol 2,4-cyclodiphosphate synthase [Candidatus Nanopelagicales bacterium]
MRTGLSLDVHPFDPARPLWLAGLLWPDHPGLSGDSDGDVVAHVIAESLLSATGLGDLGSIFGVGKTARTGITGADMLREVANLISDAGFKIENVAVQVICQTPKISDRRLEAQTVLTEALGAIVNLTATSTDGLGFTGRKEGIAAIASALVSEI